MSLDFPKRSATENLRANYPTCEAKWDKYLLLFLRQKIFGEKRKKDPRLCRVNHLSEPFYKVGTGIGCFRLSASRPAQENADMHTAIKDKVPRSKMLAQKQMLITHIAGAN